jgi:O-antigen ligase
VLIIGFLIHIIRFRPKLFTGKLFYPLLLLLAAMLLSMINAEFIDINYLFYCLIGVFYLLIYFFFKGSAKGDNLQFLIKLFVISGILVSLQVLIFYLRVDDVVLALETKNLDLGWGISNFVATYLIIFISATFYFIKKYKLHIFWVLVAAFEIIMLVYTLSRGGIFAFIITFVLLMYYLFHGYDHKFSMAVNVTIGFVVVVITILIAREYFAAVWHRLSDGFFVDNGRFDLWIQAWDKFKSHPIFGAGLFARVTDSYFGFYHNTFIHTIATLGLVGLASIIWQIKEVVKMFINKWTVEKSILLIALIGANIHGMVDKVYYIPQFMIIFFIIIAAVENYNELALEVEIR